MIERLLAGRGTDERSCGQRRSVTQAVDDPCDRGIGDHAGRAQDPQPTFDTADARDRRSAVDRSPRIVIERLTTALTTSLTTVLHCAQNDAVARGVRMCDAPDL